MDDFQLYMAAWAITDLVYEYASPTVFSVNDNWLEDWRNTRVNPYYSQTSSGLFLELYYGRPGSIYTPWGKWDCWGSAWGCWEEKMPKLLDRLGAVVNKALWYNHRGQIGPVLAVHRVENLILPSPVLRVKGKELSVSEAIAEWDRHGRAYSEELKRLGM